MASHVLMTSTLGMSWLNAYNIIISQRFFFGFFYPKSIYILVGFFVFYFAFTTGRVKILFLLTISLKIYLDCLYAPFNMASSPGRSQLHFNMAQKRLYKRFALATHI